MDTRNIEGGQVFDNHGMNKTNKVKLINVHYAFIMSKKNHLKECGHENLHEISVVLPKEKIKVQRSLHYHNINTKNFPS